MPAAGGRVCRRHDNRMNRALVALVAASVAMLPCAAPAQIANVTLYGDLNLDLEFVGGKQPDGNNPTVVRVSSNSSRFGFAATSTSAPDRSPYSSSNRRCRRTPAAARLPAAR